MLVDVRSKRNILAAMETNLLKSYFNIISCLKRKRKESPLQDTLVNTVKRNNSIYLIIKQNRRVHKVSVLLYLKVVVSKYFPT
jgi:hypothetical protein